MAVRLMLLVYALTLFASATLLFVLEPLVGKMILPKLGGSPAVWNTCVVFFQAILLAGYAYAHASVAWLGVRRQAYLHLGLLSAALVFLLASPSPLWLHHRLLQHAAEQPVLGLLACLSVSYSIPLFVVCTSAPLLQKWFSSTSHPAASDPYFLYGASNLGSMLALLSYPTLLEPYLHLAQQRWLWLAGYGLLLVLTAVCALYLWRSSPAAAAGKEISTDEPDRILEQEPGVSMARWLRWLVLAFVPSSLMLGATSYMTTDVAPIPLLWVLPLGLYLLSFILVFARMPEVLHRILVMAMPPLVLALLFMMLSGVRPDNLAATIGCHLLVLFVVSMVCHGELARDRPSTRYLTAYFLWISVGGVAGGLFNSLLAPVLFHSLAEYPLVLVLACFLIPPLSFSRSLHWSLLRDGLLGLACLTAVVVGGILFYQRIARSPDTAERLAGRSWTWEGAGLLLLIGMGVTGILRTRGDRRTAALDLLLPLCLGALALGLSWGVDPGEESDRYLLSVFGLPACLAFAFVGRPLRFGLGVGLFVLAASVSSNAMDRSLYQQRSFFGILTVGEQSLTWPAGPQEEKLAYRYLLHGGTMHGRQFLREDLQDIPLTYYCRTGPLGQVLTACNTRAQRSLGVIGLGTGTVACYALPGQHLTFYEIDPLVRDLAFADDTAYFTYIRNARQRGAHVDLVLGDARVEMDRQKLAERERFGILVIDAFSSDAIPIHLITREAIEVYLKHLADDGILAFHITNRHLDLEPVLANLARDLNLTALLQRDGGSGEPGKRRSWWVVLARRPEDLRCLEKNKRWKPLQPNPHVGVWTDDYSNVLSVFTH